MKDRQEHFRQNMQDKELTQVLDTEHFKSFRLTKIDYDGRMGSTMITFTPEGIIIHGDLTPGRRGVISDLGYGLGWFSKSLSGSYLCEKFLSQGWHAEIAIHELKEWLKNGGNPWYDEEKPASPEVVKKLKALIGSLEGDVVGQHEFYDALRDVYDDDPNIFDDGAPGWGYDPIEAGWLVAIQTRFAELIQKEKPDDGEGEVPKS